MSKKPNKTLAIRDVRPSIVFALLLVIFITIFLFRFFYSGMDGLLDIAKAFGLAFVLTGLLGFLCFFQKPEEQTKTVKKKKTKKRRRASAARSSDVDQPELSGTPTAEQIRAQKETARKIADLERQLRERTEELANAKSASVAPAKLAEIQKELALVTQQATSHKNAAEALRKELAGKRQGLETLRQDNQQLKRAAQQAETARAQMEKRMEQVDALEQAKRQLTAELAEATTGNADLSAQLAQLREQVEQVEVLREDNRSLSEDLNAANERSTKLSDELSQLRERANQADALEGDKQQLTADLTEATSRGDALSSENTQLKAQLDALDPALAEVAAAGKTLRELLKQTDNPSPLTEYLSAAMESPDQVGQILLLMDDSVTLISEFLAPLIVKRDQADSDIDQQEAEALLTTLDTVGTFLAQIIARLSAYDWFLDLPDSMKEIILEHCSEEFHIALALRILLGDEKALHIMESAHDSEFRDSLPAGIVAALVMEFHRRLRADSANAETWLLYRRRIAFSSTHLVEAVPEVVGQAGEASSFEQLDDDPDKWILAFKAALDPKFDQARRAVDFLFYLPADVMRDLFVDAIGHLSDDATQGGIEKKDQHLLGYSPAYLLAFLDVSGEVFKQVGDGSKISTFLALTSLRHPDGKSTAGDRQFRWRCPYRLSAMAWISRIGKAAVRNAIGQQSRRNDIALNTVDHEFQSFLSQATGIA